jgi:hypothetical protein
MARIIAAQQPVGHELIDGEHVVLAEWWLRTVKSEPLQFAFFVARLKKPSLRAHG